MVFPENIHTLTDHLIKHSCGTGVHRLPISRVTVCTCTMYYPQLGLPTSVNMYPESPTTLMSLPVSMWQSEVFRV